MPKKTILAEVSPLMPLRLPSNDVIVVSFGCVLNELVACSKGASHLPNATHLQLK